MNTAELVTKVAKDTGLSKTKAEAALKSITNTISDQVKKGEVVKLVGFGTFKKTARAARKGHNPQTGEQIKIPARKVPKFTPGKEFKNLVQKARN